MPTAYLFQHSKNVRKAITETARKRKVNTRLRLTVDTVSVEHEYSRPRGSEVRKNPGLPNQMLAETTRLVKLTVPGTEFGRRITVEHAEHKHQPVVRARLTREVNHGESFIFERDRTPQEEMDVTRIQSEARKLIENAKLAVRLRAKTEASKIGTARKWLGKVKVKEAELKAAGEKLVSHPEAKTLLAPEGVKIAVEANLRTPFLEWLKKQSPAAYHAIKRTPLSKR